ncbi:hypothetical protein FHS63_003674 [Azospirillum doebereinerae]|nr:hypothetical protein [Azospirillum doebereinerae]MCG5239407.1 hypothetical protein [Azospirillum doebereinerae]
MRSPAFACSSAWASISGACAAPLSPMRESSPSRTAAAGMPSRSATAEAMRGCRCAA